MNRTIFLGFICSLLLISLAGFCMAEGASGYVVYVQGGKATITEDSAGDKVITVQDVIPYYHVASGNQSKLIPIEGLSAYSYPLNAVVFLSGTDNESTSLMMISNLSFSDANSVMALHVSPVEFYDGELLKSFIKGENVPNLENNDISTVTGMYLEIPRTHPENAHGIYDNWYLCMGNCVGEGNEESCESVCQGYTSP